MATAVEGSDAAGRTEYGAAQLALAEHGGELKGADEDSRSCGSFFAGPDWTVLLLPWLLFSMVLTSFGVGSQILLGVLAVLFGFSVSGVLVYLSIGRGGPWTFFGMLCVLSVLMGLLFGILVRTEGALQEPGHGRSLGWCIIVMLVYLLLVLAISRALPSIGCSLIGSSAAFAEKNGWGWNPAAAVSMKFGCDCRNVQDILMESTDFPEQVSADLMRHRCYWSGEPGFDYVFHLANEHSFVGVLFAHPANPYEKYERFLVLAIVVALIVFPTAAFTVAVNNAFARGIITLILVTAPRNLLRLYLKRIVIADDEILHKDLLERKAALLHQREQQAQCVQPSSEVINGYGEKAERRSSRMKWKAAASSFTAPQGLLRYSSTWREASAKVRAASAFKWEAIFFSVLITLSIFVIVVTCLYVKAHSKRPLHKTLLEGTGGLGWAFVLELIFDLLVAHRSSDKHRGVEESWFAGFFHRWRQERDEYIKNPMD